MFNLYRTVDFIILFILIITLNRNSTLCRASILKEKLKPDEITFWHEYGLKYLKSRIDSIQNQKLIKKAKNVILFLGDGMGMTTITAGRIYKGQLNNKLGEESSLTFDHFPHIGMAKTYNLDKQVPDSAGTATAIFTGIKTLYGVIGMDHSTSPSHAEAGKLHSFMKWAQKSGRKTGIVTTTRITHATPAATYASVYDRDWECDSEIPIDSRSIYKDIARQLVENEPGRNFNVIFGGGLKPMGKENINEKSTIQFDGDTEKICNRSDNKNLVNFWLELSGQCRVFVQNRDELMNINLKNVSHVMGLFRNNHITYSIAQEINEPSLSEMVQQAIRILSIQNDNGFVLMVEGGRIDQAHHQNYAHAALHEVYEFDKAIEIVLNMTTRNESLIIVTADHSHSMTLNGYPKRGNDVLGFANKNPTIYPYETITYANGPGFYNHRTGLPTSYINTTEQKRFGTWIAIEEIDAIERSKPTYKHLAAFPTKDETHGGEDVPVFAIGPGSELIGGVFEQNYIAYMMSYVGCMGPAKNVDTSCIENISSAENRIQIIIFKQTQLFSICLLCLFFNLII